MSRWTVGDKPMQFGNVATAALMMGGGTATTPASTTLTTATAGKNFAGFFTRSSATSGDSRGLYWRHYVAGVGGDGEAGRFFTTVTAATSGGVHGLHRSLSFGALAGCSGEAAAGRDTLQIPNEAMIANGTYAATLSEIYSDGASSDPAAVTALALWRGTLSGNATGIGTADDKAFALLIDGNTIGSGNICEASTTEAKYAYSVRCRIGGTTMYLMCADSVG
jgi:hypothetical protein